MTSIADHIKKYTEEIGNYQATLVAVSKTKPNEDILEAYQAGQRVFGENKVQELREKSETLPKDISWHMIGHLQRNKVKYIAPFVTLIHAVDSLRLLQEIDKQAAKNNRIIDCLLQIHIADETTKFGFSYDEATDLINSTAIDTLKNIRITGLMGMATNTDDSTQVKAEFDRLKSFFDTITSINKPNIAISELSIGMSGDYKIALESGSTMVRIGSALFGARNYH